MTTSRKERRESTPKGSKEAAKGKKDRQQQTKGQQDVQEQSENICQGWVDTMKMTMKMPKKDGLDVMSMDAGAGIITGAQAIYISLIQG